MSVIIRLQNLSWSANSVDIRQFFHGLAIPEGGVHIVGGPKGDAFIAFATDEDARQGMERSGGVIKDTKIKLLLSSRSEMQKVIEQARSAVASAPPPPIVAPVPPPPPAAVSTPAPAPVERHRHRSRSRDRRSPDRRRSRRSSLDRRRSRERSRDRIRDRRRHEDPKKDDRRDRDSRHKSGDRLSDPPKVDNPHHVAAELPPGIPDQAAPWKSSFQAAEKGKAGPVWDTIKANIDTPPMDAGLIPRVPQVPMPGPVYDAVPAPTDRPPIYPEEAKMGPSDFRGVLPQIPPMGNPDSRHPPQMHTGEPPMDMPSGPIGFGAPRESRFDFNNKMGPDRTPNFNMPMEGSYPPSDLPPYDHQRPMGGLPSGNFNNGLLPDGNNSMDGPFEPGRPSSDYYPPPNRGGFGGGSEGFHGNTPPFNEHRMDGGYPTSNKKPRHYLKGYCIEIKDLSMTSSYKDVREHFRGLHIPSDGLKICREGSRRNGMAYVKFISERDQMEALSRTGPSRLGQYIEMRPCSEQEFDSGIDPNHNPRNPNNNVDNFNRGGVSGGNNVRNDEFVVILKGLPYQCSESDVANFFRGIKIKNMHIDYDKIGKALGTGMVSFYNSESCTRALEQSHQRISHRYIEVILANSTEPRGPPRHEVGPPNGPMPSRYDTPSCVALRHLPLNVIDRDIAHFFGVVGAAPHNIHIMLGFDGRPCGDAFAEFNSQHEFDKALSRDGQYLHNSRVMVTPINFQEMRDILNQPNRKPEPPAHMLPSEFDPRTRDQPWPSQPPKPAEEHAPFNGRGSMPPPQEMRGPPATMQGPEGFGKPGCVIGISGIPSTAGVSDILEFLKEFDIKKEHVIRRFDQGQNPTGDARVSLTSPQDAQQAASLLNNRPIAGHPVHVFVP